MVLLVLKGNHSEVLLDTESIFSFYTSVSPSLVPLYITADTVIDVGCQLLGGE